MKIKFARLIVRDQDDALAFYTEKLGFRVKQDESYGPDSRWLSLVSPDDEEGVALLLEKASDGDGSRAFQQRQYELGKPAASFGVDDLDAAHDSLTAKGVTFFSPPSDQAYGGRDAVFDDGCGNRMNLHQN